MTNENCLTPQGFSIPSPIEWKSCKKKYRIYIVMVNSIMMMMQMQMSIWISQEEITAEYLYDNRDESFPKCILLIFRFWRIYEKK